MSILSISLIVIISLGFVSLKKRKFNNDIKLLTSKTWLPIRHRAPISEVDSFCKINFNADQTYKMTATAKPGVIIKGDTLMEGKWSVGENKEIHILCYGQDKVIGILGINNNDLKIEIKGEEHAVMSYSASQYTVPAPSGTLSGMLSGFLSN